MGMAGEGGDVGRSCWQRRKRSWRIESERGKESGREEYPRRRERHSLESEGGRERELMRSE